MELYTAIAVGLAVMGICFILMILLSNLFQMGKRSGIREAADVVVGDKKTDWWERELIWAEARRKEKAVTND